MTEEEIKEYMAEKKYYDWWWVSVDGEVRDKTANLHSIILEKGHKRDAAILIQNRSEPENSDVWFEVDPPGTERKNAKTHFVVKRTHEKHTIKIPKAQQHLPHQDTEDSSDKEHAATEEEPQLPHPIKKPSPPPAEAAETETFLNEATVKPPPPEAPEYAQSVKNQENHRLIVQIISLVVIVPLLIMVLNELKQNNEKDDAQVENNNDKTSLPSLPFYKNQKVIPSGNKSSSITHQEEDGLAVCEAENYAQYEYRKVFPEANDWQKEAAKDYKDFSGIGVMVAQSNKSDPRPYNSNNTKSSALHYKIKFTNTGEYTIWIRYFNIYPLQGTFAFNGEIVKTDESRLQWSWKKIGTLTVTKPGTQTISFKRRFRFMALDKIILCKDATRPFYGFGPPSSKLIGKGQNKIIPKTVQEP